MDAATLEWSIRHLEGTTYTVDTRFWPAGSTSDAQLVPGALPRIELDSLALLPLLSDPQAYGAALTSRLFADERLLIAFHKARASAETDAVPLRVLLRLDASDSTIHGLAWETLQDVERGGFLFQSERVLLARMLDSPDLTPLTPRPRGTVRALIVVAHPSGLEDYGLAPIDVTGEIARCRLALGAIPLTVLARESTGQAANLTNLRAALRDEPDILYLVAHGTHRDGQPYLWLEHDDGTIDRVAGNEFARSLAQLPRQPLLVVLASCQSGGQSHDDGALAAVGPQLAVAGVAAVVGMQGNVAMGTVAASMPVFFQELLRDGQIDRALAAARAAVQSQFDWWLPVLWLRLKEGRLLTARSYQIDIQRLRDVTDRSLLLVAHHAVLPFSTGEQFIQRECFSDLRGITRSNSLLIVGEPGAGKSGVIYDFVRTLVTDRQDVLFLIADDLDAGSLGRLREELGLEHDLIDVLDNWPGVEPAYLVIDSLDSARDSRSASMLQNLMRMVIQQQGRWHVVASIRKFDLRNSAELHALFPGMVETAFQDPEFSATRHINVPRLSDAELAQITSRSLRTLLQIASPAMQELLRVPFNLRLIVDLLDTGVDPAQISLIRTQLGLLDRYWKARVIDNDGQGDARDYVLRTVCSHMVSAHIPHCERSQIANIATSQPINTLLRRHVLIEHVARPSAPLRRSILAFSHDVLFDYAVARLLLYNNPQNCPDLLANDPDLVLSIQPSFLLLYRMLWSDDEHHDDFWNLAFRMMEENRVPPIAQIISCVCVAELTSQNDDLAPLWEHLYNTGGVEQAIAEQLFGHLIGALQTDPELLIFPKAETWCGVAEYVTRSLRPAIAYPIRLLIWDLSEEPRRLSQGQLTNLGLAARRLLEFAWSEPQRNDILVQQALQAVCRTFASDSVSATRILERCLQNPQVSQYGYADLPVITRNLDWILAVAPAFVEQIYRVTFDHEETSDTLTSVTGSRIANIVFTRRQSFESAQYLLTQHFSSFLARHPFPATRALLAALTTYIRRNYSSLLSTDAGETFDIHDKAAMICADYSEMWDQGHRHHENALKMLDAFEQYLDAISQDEQQHTNLHPLVDLLIEQNTLAVIWRRILRSATRYPATLGAEIRPLSWAMPLFLGYATRSELGHFIMAIYPLADQNDRERMEQLLLSVPDALPDERRTNAETWRNRVIASLPHELILPELQAIRAQIGTPDEFQDDTIPDDPFTWVADTSALLATPRRVEGRFGELTLPIHQFLQQSTNRTVSEEVVELVLPAMRVLYEVLQQSQSEDTDDEVAFNRAWDTLAQACSRVTALQSLDCQDERGIFLRGLLLASSQQAHPMRGMIDNASFEETPGWGVGYARIEAAEGLMRLVRRTACLDQEVLDSLVRLCHDPVPAVRYQVAARLLSLLQVAPDLVWSLLEELCHQESSRGILQGICAFVLRRLASSYPERIIPLVEIIFDRTDAGVGAQKVRTDCVDIFLDIDFWRVHPACRTRIQQIVSDPVRYKDQAQHILGSLRGKLTLGPVEPTDPAQELVRLRAFEILWDLFREARSRLSRIESAQQGVPFDAWGPEVIEEMQSLMHLFDSIARELFFSSGSFEVGRDRRPGEEPPLTEAQRRRFYIEAKSLIDEVAQVGHPSITHHLIELLEECVSFDPRGVFLQVVAVVQHGRDGGYQLESIAADHIVKLVERYLAEYRPLLREDKDCRSALQDILAIFVRWPQAYRLVYRLGGIFR